MSERPPSPAAKWNERYSARGYFYGTEPNAFLKERATEVTPGGRVLCLAEGEGRNAVFLAARGFEVTAVDASHVGLEKLDLLARERGVSVRTAVADLAEYDLGKERWDGIVSIWCHLPSALRKDVHRRCVEALKPGGILILEAYTPRQLEYKTGGPPDVDLLMELASLRTELKGLQLEHALETVREIHEGKGHNGPSSVVQLVARKPQGAIDVP